VSAATELPVEPGLPVEIGRIDKELGKLWEESGDTKTRASLINLAIYTEDPLSVGANTELISEIATEHACRALLVIANPAASAPQAKAWISAHCHLAGKGRQVCSEQITFQLDGDLVAALPNIVFSHLDSDLPLCFWWQGNFREPLDKKLWAWVDRLIYDSATWEDAATQFPLVKKIGCLTETRTILCDLNWTRLFGIRFALAQLFDHAIALAHIGSIRKVTISAPHRTTGLLLLGWFASQLGWRLQGLLGKNFFATAEGKHVEFEIAASEAIHCAFECEDAKFQISREPNSEYCQARICGVAGCESPMLVASGKIKPEDILILELSRGGRHPLYAKALAMIDPLL